MNKKILEAMFYILIAIGFCIVMGSTFSQAKSTEQPTAPPESYFTAPEVIEEPPYNPCNDPYLQYERSVESQQRKKQCGIKE